MKELFVKKLIKKERDFVYILINDKKFGYRGLIIAMSYEGYPVSVICKRLNVHPVDVRKLIRRFNIYAVMRSFSVAEIWENCEQSNFPHNRCYILFGIAKNSRQSRESFRA